ncbi:MAG: DUF4112 domain-containing protein [Pirellulaceae bacterium]
MKKYPDDDQLILTPQQREASPQLRWVDGVTRLLDTKFRIPGTQTRFGADFLLGLVPGLGDVISMGFSGMLLATMAKNGASGRVVARMLVNVALDTVIGSIPVLGNLFDLYFKANTRNLVLMREYYEHDKHRGSAWPVVAGVIVAVSMLFCVVAGGAFLIIRYLWNQV